MLGARMLSKGEIPPNADAASSPSLGILREKNVELSLGWGNREEEKLHRDRGKK